MKTAIIELMFKEDVNDEWIQGFINNLYIDNESKIEGMEYTQFAKKEILVDIHRLINNRIKQLDEIVEKLKTKGATIR